MLAITVGGELEKLASRYKAPVFKINYGSPPRAALGWSFIAVMGIFHKLGIAEIEGEDIRESIVLMKGLRAKLGIEVPTYQNEAKKAASAEFRLVKREVDQLQICRH